MSCRKPQNVGCQKFYPHTKYLQACKRFASLQIIFQKQINCEFAGQRTREKFAPLC